MDVKWYEKDFHLIYVISCNIFSIAYSSKKNSFTRFQLKTKEWKKLNIESASWDLNTCDNFCWGLFINFDVMTASYSGGGRVGLPFLRNFFNLLSFLKKNPKNSPKSRPYKLPPPFQKFLDTPLLLWNHVSRRIPMPSCMVKYQTNWHLVHNL